MFKDTGDAKPASPFFISVVSCNFDTFINTFPGR